MNDLYVPAMRVAGAILFFVAILLLYISEEMRHEDRQSAREKRRRKYELDKKNKRSKHF